MRTCRRKAAYATDCLDTADGRTDSDGDGCGWWYVDAPADCGSYDDDDFAAGEVCCACGGGDRGAVASALTFSGLTEEDARTSTGELEQGTPANCKQTRKTGG